MRIILNFVGLGSMCIAMLFSNMLYAQNGKAKPSKPDQSAFSQKTSLKRKKNELLPLKDSCVWDAFLLFPKSLLKKDSPKSLLKKDSPKKKSFRGKQSQCK